MTDRITLTEEQREQLDGLHFCTPTDPSDICHKTQRSERVLAAFLAQAKAEALRGAAKAISSDMWRRPPGLSAEKFAKAYLNDLANTYDPKSGDNE